MTQQQPQQLMIGGFPVHINIARENIKILIMGPPKTGKTSAIGRAYAVYDQRGVITGYRVFYIVIGDATALTALQFQTFPDGTTYNIGVTPPFIFIDPATLQGRKLSEAFWAAADDLTRLMASCTPADRPFDAVCIDGLNFLAQGLEKEVDPAGKVGWAKWEVLNEFFLTKLIAWATYLGRAQGHGLEVYFVGHARDPSYTETGPNAGKLAVRGGVALASKKMTEQFAAKVDVAFRVDTERPAAGLGGAVPDAERVLFTAPEPEWATGSRFNLFAQREKLDLTEVLKRIRALTR